MSRLVTVRDPEYIGRNFPEIRRGFLDVNTPVAALSELQLPVEKQKQILVGLIEALQERRAELRGRLPVKGGVLTYRQKKNLAAKLNKEARFRNKVRSLARMSAVDEFVELGRRIQELCIALRAIKQPVSEFASLPEKHE